MFDEDKLEELKDIANENIEEVLNSLDIECPSFNGIREIRMCCPVHDGDNPTGFSYNIEYKYWHCYTSKCHLGNGNIFGLVKLIKQKEDSSFGFWDSVKYLAKLFSYNIEDNTEPLSLDKKLLNKEILSRKKYKQKERKNKYFPIPLSKMEGSKFPSKYFIDNGFSLETIKKFYLGECHDPYKPMYNRAFAPVISGDEIIGVTGRTLHPECKKCEYFHDEKLKCPKEDPNTKACSKWLHYGFNKSQYIYNLNYSENFIKEKGSVIITEGPKEIWWLDQCGIFNTGSILGVDLSKSHVKTLIKTGCSKIILALDNDEAGRDSVKSITENFGHLFKIYNFSEYYNEYNDIDDISKENIEKKVKPILEELNA